MGVGKPSTLCNGGGVWGKRDQRNLSRNWLMFCIEELLPEKIDDSHSPGSGPSKQEGLHKEKWASGVPMPAVCSNRPGQLRFRQESVAALRPPQCRQEGPGMLGKEGWMCVQTWWEGGSGLYTI